MLLNQSHCSLQSITGPTTAAFVDCLNLPNYSRTWPSIGPTPSRLSLLLWHPILKVEAPESGSWTAHYWAICHFYHGKPFWKWENQSSAHQRALLTARIWDRNFALAMKGSCGFRKIVSWIFYEKRSLLGKPDKNGVNTFCNCSRTKKSQCFYNCAVTVLRRCFGRQLQLSYTAIWKRFYYWCSIKIAR